jgi:hypothetical protein
MASDCRYKLREVGRAAVEAHLPIPQRISHFFCTIPPVKKKFKAVMLVLGELYPVSASRTSRSSVRILRGPLAFLNLKHVDMNESS